MLDDRRGVPRHEISALIRIGDTCGTTRNLSTGGVLFVFPHSFRIGDTIAMEIDVVYHAGATTIHISATGTVTRVERLSRAEFLVAAAIDQLRVPPPTEMSAADEDAAPSMTSRIPAR